MKSREFLEKLGRVVTRNIFFVVAILVIVGMFLMVWSFDKRQASVVYYFVAEVGKAIVITALVTGVTKWYLAREYTDLISTGQKIYEDEYKQELKATLDGMETKILGQTQTIAHYASSLDAMQKADIVQIYESRGKASDDIRRDIQDPNITYLRIIGISLNDFLRPGGSVFHDAWRTIEHYIKGDHPLGHTLDVKVLLIDPTCDGAYYRSKSEETEVVGIAGRLKNDVLDSMKALKDLERLSKNLQVNLEAKLYNTPPILYLVQTNFVSYAHQYHFWTQYNPDLNIPVIRYQGKSLSGIQGRSMHDELRFHFEYIWKNCSVSIPEYLDQNLIGCDDAIRQANIDNIYYEQSVCKKRIIYLMNTARERLYVKGVTLRSFFSDGEIFDTFCRVATREGMKVRVLIIDPESEQAKIRSFREYLLRNPSAKWENFCERELHKEQILNQHTRESVRQMVGFLEDLRDRGIQHNISAKKYFSAPESFTLMTDDSVLVEQYHYGKIRPINSASEIVQSKILGGDVPVVEYKKPDLEKIQEFPLQNIYRIFEDNFEFVFNNFSKDVRPG